MILEDPVNGLAVLAILIVLLAVLRFAFYRLQDMWQRWLSQEAP